MKLPVLLLSKLVQALVLANQRTIDDRYFLWLSKLGEADGKLNPCLMALEHRCHIGTMLQRRLSTHDRGARGARRNFRSQDRFRSENLDRAVGDSISGQARRVFDKAHLECRVHWLLR